jgi:hypothetical protein
MVDSLMGETKGPSHLVDEALRTGWYYTCGSRRIHVKFFVERPGGLRLDGVKESVAEEPSRRYWHIQVH